jgi:hypothetical protein
MNVEFIFGWGQSVRVRDDAPQEMFPGQSGSVCGMRMHGGLNLYLVEFATGVSKEIPQVLLERADAGAQGNE